ncbi:MAG: hypothetical protein ACRDL0_15400 [Thermoleophilaceae bacterium]
MTTQAQEREDRALRDTQEVHEATPGQVLLATGILVALVAVAVWGFISLAPDDAPEKRDPSFIDSIFANVVVIAAARVVLLAGAVVLLFAGVYIMISTAVRMGRGQWLRRAGPFETDLAEQEKRLGEAEDFFEDWLEATEQNEELVNRLAQRDEQVEQLLRDREALLRALEERDVT